MSRCSCALDIALRKTHGLIGKSLKPKNPREKATRQHPLVILKSDCVRSVNRRYVVCKHALGMTPGVGVISHVMQDDADQAITNQPIKWIRCRRGQCRESLSQAQRDPKLAANRIIKPQAMKGARLIVSVIKTLCNLEGIFPGHPGFGSGALGICQRYPEGGTQLHLAARAAARIGTEARECSLDPAATLIHQ